MNFGWAHVPFGTERMLTLFKSKLEPNSSQNIDFYYVMREIRSSKPKSSGKRMKIIGWIASNQYNIVELRVVFQKSDAVVHSSLPRIYAYTHTHTHIEKDIGMVNKAMLPHIETISLFCFCSPPLRVMELNSWCAFTFYIQL